MNRTKAELRQISKARRLALERDEVKQKSRSICTKLLDEIDWTSLRNVHIYKSVRRLREVETGWFITELKKRAPAVKIEAAGRTRSEPVPTKRFDLIIAPVLAFDKDNFRLGWGAGWYDRFLAGQPQALKVGLAYQASIIANGIPSEGHDVPLDKIITETSVY